MKNSVDDILLRLARRVHSPHGLCKADDRTYRLLFDRIPPDERPVIGWEAPRRRAFPWRWGAAACLLCAVGLGLVWAGVWYYHFRLEPSSGSASTLSEEPAVVSEPRTLAFQQVPLAEIVAELSSAFDVDVRIDDPGLCDYQITATFSTDEPLEEILNVLAEIGGCRVRETPEGFSLYR